MYILFIEMYYKERDSTECDLVRLKSYCEKDWTTEIEEGLHAN